MKISSALFLACPLSSLYFSTAVSISKGERRLWNVAESHSQTLGLSQDFREVGESDHFVYCPGQLTRVLKQTKMESEALVRSVDYALDCRVFCTAFLKESEKNNVTRWVAGSEPST